MIGGSFGLLGRSMSEIRMLCQLGYWRPTLGRERKGNLMLFLDVKQPNENLDGFFD